MLVLVLITVAVAKWVQETQPQRTTSVAMTEQPKAKRAEEKAADTTGATETRIPRSVSGDKGRYYLMEKETNGDIITTLHSRYGVNEIGYTRSEVNCKTRKFRVLGYSEESADAMTGKPGSWTSLVPGSSKSDLVNFVCTPR